MLDSKKNFAKMFVCYNPSYTLTSSFVIAPPSPPPPPPGLQGGKLVPPQHHKNWDSIHRGDGLKNIIGGEREKMHLTTTGRLHHFIYSQA